MSRRSRIMSVSVGGTLALAMLAASPAQSQAPPGESSIRASAPAVVAAVTNGRIAFSTGFLLINPEAAHSQVFTVNPDGSDLQQLTHVPPGSNAGAPDYSPDGETIAYISNVSGNYEVWTMDADGGNQAKLLGRPDVDYFQPRWSPDGSQLVVTACDVSLGFTSECDLDLVNADGSGRHRLVGGHRNNGDAMWSPDGQSIAFDSDRAGFLSTIWVVPAAGGTPTRITKPNLEAMWPIWSPDGEHLVVMNNCCRPHSDLYRMRPDGSQLQLLRRFDRRKVGAFFPAYSPDGTKIVVISDELRPVGVDKRDVFTMRADGTHLKRIVDDRPQSVMADWGVEVVL